MNEELKHLAAAYGAAMQSGDMEAKITSAAALDTAINAIAASGVAAPVSNLPKWMEEIRQVMHAEEAVSAEMRTRLHAVFSEMWDANDAALNPTPSQPVAAEATAEVVPGLTAMRAAFRTTQIIGGEKPAFQMVFQFPSLDALHAADDEWRAYAKRIGAEDAGGMVCVHGNSDAGSDTDAIAVAAPVEVQGTPGDALETLAVLAKFLGIDEAEERARLGYDGKAPVSHIFMAAIERFAIAGRPAPAAEAEPVAPNPFQPGRFKAWKQDINDLHSPWFLVTPGGDSFPFNHNADDAVDCARAMWVAAACNAYTRPAAPLSEGESDEREKGFRDGVAWITRQPVPKSWAPAMAALDELDDWIMKRCPGGPWRAIEPIGVIRDHISRLASPSASDALRPTPSNERG